MFSVPLNFNQTVKYDTVISGCSCTNESTLKDRVISLFSRNGWEISFASPFGEYPHILVKDTRFGGYAIGVVVYKFCEGVISCQLENPAGTGMSAWTIPFKGSITPEKIIGALISCIDVFENEEIPDPDEIDPDENEENQNERRV